MNTLDELIKNQYSTIEDLFHIVQLEHSTLKSKPTSQPTSQSSYAKLSQLAAQKKALLQIIQDNDDKIANHADKSLLNSNTDYIAKIKQIKQNLAQCQRYNQISAEIISLKSASISRLQQALTIITNSHTMTYDGKGITQSLNTSGNKLEV